MLLYDDTFVGKLLSISTRRCPFTTEKQRFVDKQFKLDITSTPEKILLAFTQHFGLASLYFGSRLVIV
jgi:hypothetical protein